jgi:class 3 adenylate cyclase/tetratricopeptide (TPR) repeat protein
MTLLQTGMSTLSEILAGYVPALILRRFASDPSPLETPEMERFPAAMLFADIAGFTALTEQLAQRGPVGAEQLSDLLNAYFEQLTGLVMSHGGEVVKLAGDALIAGWSTVLLDEPLATVSQRAAQCALAVQATLHNYEVAEGICLSLRVGIGAGEVVAAHVGGLQDRWELLLAGTPLIQMSAAQQAQPGETVLSAEAWALVQEVCAGTPLGGGGVRLDAVAPSLPLRAAPIPPPVPEADAALWGYLPGALRSRLAAGQTGWLAELRRVTVLFVNLLDLNVVAPESLAHIQTVMRTLQMALYRYEGSIVKLGMDDKGVTLVAALGLPPLAHEDDAVRGVQAAQALQGELRELGVRTGIGITTGRVFCGAVGSVRRREYSLVGDVVNLSARLMQAAPKGILCDAATYEAAQEQLTFEALPPIVVKGKSEPVAIYRPFGRSRVSRSQPPMFGRRVEQARLAERLEALQTGTGSIVLVEGEAGIGKSRLVADLMEQARVRGVPCLAGAGDAVEKSRPYHALESIFSQILYLEGLSDPAARRQQVLDQLRREPEWLRLAPLLNSVLPLDLPENELTVHMSGQVRADNTHELLLRIMEGTARRGLLVLEDAHWLDSASWALARLASQRLPSTLLVILSRPLAEPLPTDCRELLESSNLHRLVLEALPAEEALALVCERLGVTRLPEPVAALIQEKAEGHPFFSEELAYALRDAGLIQTVNGQCQLAPGVNLGAVSFPDSVQGVITSRIDRLTPSQQLSLKVASVIGRVFAFRLLREIYPLESERPLLPDNLQILDRLDITPLDTLEPDLAYIFKHMITLEVSYSLMLFGQRRQLHQAIAQWYEQTCGQDLTASYPLLAYHWSQAQDEVKALFYLGEAGEQALRSGAYQEAVGFLREALALGARAWPGTAGTRDPLQEARWERQLGKAYLGLGQLDESRKHLQRAVAQLGWPVHSSQARLLVGLVGQVLLQVLHRIAPTRFRAPSAAVSHRVLEAARAYERLAELDYFANDTFRTVNACLRTLNLSEAAGPSPELARAYANTSIAASLIPAHSLAEAYSRRALEIANSGEHLSALSWVLELTGLYHMGTGQWTVAINALRRAAEIAERLGDHRRWEESFGLLAEVICHQGEFIHSVELYADLYSRARRNGSFQAQAWGLQGQAKSFLPLGRLDDAKDLLEASVALLPESIGHTDEINTQGLLALAYWRRGEQQLARDAADTVAQLIAQEAPSAVTCLEGCASLAEVYLGLWEVGSEASSRQELIRRARQACATLHQMARLFPIAQPRAWLFRGRAEWLTGHSDRARKAWQHSLTWAKRLQMPYEQGLAHCEMGLHLRVDERARSVHLSQALELFTRLGARYDMARTQAEMEA